MTDPETPLDVLVVAPHPDDAEISVGGTILLSRQQGLRVGVVELTSGEPTPIIWIFSVFDIVGEGLLIQE